MVSNWYYYKNIINKKYRDYIICEGDDMVNQHQLKVIEGNRILHLSLKASISRVVLSQTF